MRTVLLITSFFIVVLFSRFGLATPISCTLADIKTQNKNIILPGVTVAHTSQIYFLQNTSKRGLWIDHPVDGKPSAKAGWSSFFQPGRWSAILINKKDFSLNCAIIEPGKVNFQECAKVITVCVPKGIKYDSKRKGSYWLAEDKSYDDLIVALNKRGINIPKAEPMSKSVKENSGKTKETNKKDSEIPKPKNAASKVKNYD